MRKQFFGILSLLLSAELFSENKKDFVSYNVVVTQGNYRTIAISKENRTRENLLVMANELEEQNKDAYQIYILVFDDEKAAKLYSRVDNLSASEDKFYADHYIATYWKSPSARHDFTIMLDGMYGKKEIIKFDSLKKENSTKKVEISQDKKELKKIESDNNIESNLTQKDTSIEETSATIIDIIFLFWIVGFIFILVKWKKYRFKVWFEFFVALILGGFGVQKFREKKIGLGILYIITLGGFFFIGWFIDSIRYLVAAIRKTPILPISDTEQKTDSLKSKGTIIPETIEVLPTVQPLGLILKASEICHFSENADYIEVKNVVVGRQGRGGGVSTRLMKGVYLHTGRTQSASVRDNIAVKTPGIFSITNQRVVFSGVKGTFNKKLSEITAITPYDDGIGLQFDEKHFLLQMKNAPTALMILNKILSEFAE